MAFEILVKKLQVKDTEAYQKMMGINYETFWSFYHLPFRFEPVLGKTADLTIIHYLPLVQTAKTIMSNLNMSKLHDI